MNEQIINRPQYIKKLLDFKDTQLIKLVTGVRRSGKSTLFDLYIKELLKLGVQTQQIQMIKLESIENEPLLDYKELYKHIVNNLVTGKQNYVFLDEIQQVPDFQKAIRSLFDRKNIDLYLTGSNSKLQSGQWATSIAGRYVEIKMYPLSFEEFVGTYPVLQQENLDKIYQEYVECSSFPYARHLMRQSPNNFQEQINIYLEGIYDTIILNDIMDNKGIQGLSRLKKVVQFIASCIGSEISVKKISDTMTSDGMKILPATVESYLEALKSAYIVYTANRYDVKGKKILKTLNKYYLVDMGIRGFLLGNKGENQGYILENIVYLELLRRGYKVYVGKTNVKSTDNTVKSVEIDFVAENSQGVEYYQVADTVMNEDTLRRELASLDAIRDHHPKFILTRDYGVIDYNGIKKINVLNWLLGK